MSTASRSVNAAYIRSALEVKAQRDEAIGALRALVAIDDGDVPALWRYEPIFKRARAIIRKAKKWA